MTTSIDLPQLQALIDRGVTLIEVLPEAEYEAEHLPGSINIPLKQLTPASVEQIDRSQPVVVYCWDAL